MVSLKAFVLIVSFIQYAESITPPNCAAVSCLAPDCPNSYTPPGECCPVCPKEHATEKPGSCPRPRGRGICVSLCGADSDCPLDKKCCSNGCGQVCQSPEAAVLPDKCSLVRCAMPADCKDTYIPKGQCCPVCRTGRSCFHKGTLHKDGQRFKDDCNFCSCRNGRVSCTKMACNPDIKVKPGKCPSHLGLGVGGICVEKCSGDSDCQLDQKCCSNGCGHTCQKPENTDCSRVICLACVGFTKPGDCCPTCSSVVT